MIRIVLLLMLVISVTAFSQNLVPNSSFEKQVKCPDGYDSFTLEEWSLPTYGSSNNFYPCETKDNYFNVPKNMLGYMFPRSGKGYSGIYLYSNSGYDKPPYREYMQVKLSKVLIKGEKYKFTCFMALADAGFATDHLQVHFSNKELYQDTQEILVLPPQITNNGKFITDRDFWTEYKGEFVAAGGEEYMILGNFDTDKNTPFMFYDILGVSSYYYIDDVSLYQCQKLVELGPDTTICKGTSYMLNAFTQGAEYHWQDNSTDSTLIVTGEGLYWVDVTKDGCYTRDSIYVYLKDPSFYIGNDTTLCKGETLILPPVDLQGPYFWSTGSTESAIQVKEEGKYWLTVPLKGCIRTDTIKVNFETPFEVALGKDTTLCFGEKLDLTAFRLGSTYTWNDNSTEAKLTIQESGNYSVTVRGIACESKDSINVKFFDCPKDIPNVITPNGDEKNELFVVKEIREDTWHIEIVNRWGHTVYEDDNYKNIWNGNGLASGVYYYNLKNLSSKRNYKGWVEILK